MKKQSEWSPEEELFAAILQKDESRFRELEPEVKQRLANMPKRSRGVVWYLGRVLPSSQVQAVAACLLLGILIAVLAYRVGRGSGVSYQSEYFAIHKERAQWLQERERLVKAHKNDGKDVQNVSLQSRLDAKLVRSLQNKVSGQQKTIQSLTAGQIKAKTLYAVALSERQQQAQIENHLIDTLTTHLESEIPHKNLDGFGGATAGPNTPDVDIVDWKPRRPVSKFLRSNKIEFVWASVPSATSYVVVIKPDDGSIPLRFSAGNNTHLVATLPDHGSPDHIQYYSWSLEIKRIGTTQLGVTTAAKFAVFDVARYKRALHFAASRNNNSRQATP